MTENTRRLLILRHAKAVADSDSGRDFDRPLAPRGQQDCTSMARLIDSQTPLPQQILCSGAVRTRQTWQAIEPHVRAPSDTQRSVSFTDELYASSLKIWLNHLQQQSDATRCVLVIGHNPELQSLLIYLAGDQVSAGSTGKIMPTATLCVLDIAMPWTQLHEDCATLLNVYRPREIPADLDGYLT